MKTATLVLPNHLFAQHPHISPDHHIIIFEHPHFFTRLSFHKQKLMLHRASLHAYYEQFDQRTYTLTYLTYDQDLWETTKQHEITHIVCCDPLDHPITDTLRELAHEHNVALSIESTPAFIDAPGAIYTLQQQSSFFMASFYKKQRKRFNILMDDDEPEGGQYSFDKENRKSLPEDCDVPHLWQPGDTYIRAARSYIKEHFPDNPGHDSPFIYPVTHADAQKWLTDFIDNRLIHFGDYQDAISKDEPFLFHSLLSPMLNTGLITPKHVIHAVMQAYRDQDIPINNIEGFIRQVLGWREYIYAVYVLTGKEQQRSNFFRAYRDIPPSFWDGSTGIPPVDMVINKVQKYAYAHHIERLMVMSNIMLLCEFRPDDIYQWFMELFIDAYDWVMVPNVYGMGTFADGGLMSTKPYISGSGYIRKMSNYSSGDWCDIWDGLYWHFIDKYAEKLDDLGRMGLIMHHYKNMSQSDIDEHNKVARSFIRSLS